MLWTIFVTFPLNTELNNFLYELTVIKVFAKLNLNFTPL